jgi:hypothetical protein
MGLTPKQFKAQLDVHADIQKQMNGAQTEQGAKAPVKGPKVGYIDQLKGW